MRTKICVLYLTDEDRAAEERLLRQLTNSALRVFLRSEFDDTSMMSLAYCLVARQNVYLPASLRDAGRSDEHFGEENLTS